ncbi:sulfurtransferase [Kitasatospora sp. NPDC094015]|uniref:sulfurtransferase n=1 Tax=Kitasatospora sp. NPDC094015 TaxID=3155205 RepID=UPI0033314F0A
MAVLPGTGPLIGVDRLAGHLDHPALVLLDASVGADEGDGRRIPGTRRFDLDGPLSDPSSPLPHTMPGPERFTRELRALGVGTDSTVVVYDRIGIYSAARAWWMLRVMGFDRVAVLDGGLPAWAAAGLPLAPAPAGQPPAGDFTARPRPGLLVDRAEVVRALAEDGTAVLDARTRERFAGQVEEVRPGLRRGHMPGASNLPFGDLQDGGRMRPATELRALFAAVAGDRERLVLSCGSGVTACVLALGADLAGYRDLAVYDGSWSEWGLPSELPVATGPAAGGPAPA